MQKGCDFEVIVCDDSDNNSVKESLLDIKDSRIKYFKNSTRLGAIENWNQSIRYANYNIIKILHHDEWFVADDGLLKSVEPILLGEAVIVFSACKAFSFQEGELSKHAANVNQLKLLRDNPSSLVFGNFIGAPSVVTFNKDLNIFFDKKFVWLSDIDFYIRLLHAAKGNFVYLPEALINVTQDSMHQLSRECENQRLRSLIENINLFSQQDYDFD